MKQIKYKQFLFKTAWIIIAAFSAVFFIVSLIVYNKAVPKNVSELLLRESSWIDTELLAATEGDLEIYPYITKVKEQEIQKERLNIRYMKEHMYAPEMSCGTIVDPSISCNYIVEYFVFSDIADKELVKRMWSMSVSQTGTASEEQLLLETGDEYNTPRLENNMDIKKENALLPQYYETFIRITAKNGTDNFGFENIFELN